MWMIGLRNGEVRGRGIHLLLQMGWRKRLWKIKLARGNFIGESK
jgi:hypothetical protein